MLPRLSRNAWLGRTSNLLVILLSVLGCAACAETPHEVVEERKTLTVGDTEVAVVVHEAEAPGLTYLNLHDDENTSVEAALNVIGRHGGRVIELQHGGERHITFMQGGRRYAFDPNRMFTDRGAGLTLAGLGDSSDAAVAAVRAFAESLLAEVGLEAVPALVALHNNTDERYSVLSYNRGGEYETDVLFVHITDDEDPDHFFFVTDRALYDRLRQGDFNAALQDNARVTDDGSLSVYAARQGVPYVNVEAQHGHFEKQVQMLEYLNEVLREGDED